MKLKRSILRLNTQRPHGVGFPFVVVWELPFNPCRSLKLGP
jgi:hypothetical protein